jgi:GT2 family glycosyltransferase
MSPPPTVSVIVCTFNRKDWLTKCLEGLELSTVQPTEIIVVDGPSTDGTRKLMEEAERVGRLRLVPQARLEGISAARNLGLGAARGEIVCFLDDDAIPAPTWLEGILSGYTAPRVGGVGGPVSHMDGKLAMGQNAVDIYGDWFDSSKGEDIRDKYPVMVGCNMSFRTEVLRQVGGFDPFFRYHQDETDACLRVVLAGYEIAYLEKVSVRHEWCEGSYRKDMLRWYLRLRYLWGRNNAHLVKKNFGGQVTLGGYVRHRLSRTLSRKTSIAGPSSPKKVESKPGKNRAMSIVGSLFEVTGSIFGWRAS